VQLGRQTDVPKVQSYQDECAMGLGGCTSSPYVGRDPANVVALIDPDVGDYRVRVALVVRRGAEGISHCHMSLEIGDDMGFCVFTIEKGPDTGGKDIKERGRENTSSGYGLGWEKNIPARYGYW
jgi:hypothetical protein